MKYLTTILTILTVSVVASAFHQVTDRPLLDNWLPTITQIHQTFNANNVTSSSCNTPPFLNNCVDQDDQFGVYHLIDKSLKHGPPIIGKLFVSYTSNEWIYSDTNQKVLAYHSTTRSNLDILNIDIQVGDPIEKAEQLFGDPILIEDSLQYFTTNNYSLVVKAPYCSITELLIWNCNITDPKIIGPLVDNYLTD